jgi:hypothetical protein
MLHFVSRSLASTPTIYVSWLTPRSHGGMTRMSTI